MTYVTIEEWYKQNESLKIFASWYYCCSVKFPLQNGNDKKKIKTWQLNLQWNRFKNTTSTFTQHLKVLPKNWFFAKPNGTMQWYYRGLRNQCSIACEEVVVACMHVELLVSQNTMNIEAA